jgi:N-acetylmuramoyl-L-alanine amidase
MNFISKLKSTFLFSLILISISSFAQSGKFKVVLDAGHGGKDFGAMYDGHIEKNIALAVVLKIGKILEKNPYIDLVYTRKTDVFIELDERANIANREKATIFVSVHCNANRSPTGQGFETYVMGTARTKSNLEVAKKENEVITLEKDYKRNYEGYNPNSPESAIGMLMIQEEYMENSIALASKIQDNFAANENRKNRGIQQAGFLVLRKSAMPRLLCEIGFISNPWEGDFLDSEEGQDEVASSIAAAIVSYKKEYFGAGANEPKVERVIARNFTPRVIEKPVVPVVDTTKNSTSIPIKVDTVIYKIQLSASTKKLELKPSNFKGLNDVTIVTDGNRINKYLYGEAGDYDKAMEILKEVKAKGHKTAFIVAVKNGKILGH